MDHPRWVDGPKEFRLLIARLLLIQLAETWEEGLPVFGAIDLDEGRDAEGRNGDRELSAGHAACWSEGRDAPGVTPTASASKSIGSASTRATSFRCAKRL
jgi:hypothetical protein